VSNNVVGSGGGFPSPAAPVSAANPLGNFPGSMTSNPVGLPNSTSAAVASVTGILTDTNYRFVLHALSSRSKPEILGEPEITTTSGRRTIMKPTTIVSVITNFTYQETATNSGVSPQTENLEVGPILDSTASVLSDGYMIDLDLKASYSEFLGYDKPTLATTAAYTKAGVKIDVPNILPRIETRQASAHMNVRDGQTVVLGGLIIPSIRTTKEKVPLLGSLPGVGRIFQSQSKEKILKNLMVFVTATIVDPAGNRIHTDAEMPFAQKGSPPQPPQPK
jgi:general secretion pathway protein D